MPEPVSCSQGERILRAILAKVSNRFIPRGRACDHVPGLSQDIKALISKRDKLRNADPTHPEIGDLNARIDRELGSSRREAWERTVMRAGPNDPSTKFCRRRFLPPVHGAPPPRTHLHHQLGRCLRGRDLDHSFNPLNTQLASHAIRNSGSTTALGPDQLNIHHLRHLGPLGLRYLTLLYNLSIANANIPSIWREAIIIAIPKAGKPPSQGTSF